jgi:hypothetical protein
VVRIGWRKSDGTLVLTESGKPKKKFSQRRPDPDNPKIWVWGLSAGDYMRRRPGDDWRTLQKKQWDAWPATKQRKALPACAKGIPYRSPGLPEAIRKSRTIFIPEGEAKVEALIQWGLCATCCAEGAGKWTSEHAVYLRDADVVILPDNDDTGQKHAEAVAQSLQGLAKRVRIVELPELPPKGDIVDWQHAGHTREEFLELADQASEW